MYINFIYRQNSHVCFVLREFREWRKFEKFLPRKIFLANLSYHKVKN